MRLRILASLRSQILTFTSVLVVMSLGAVLLVVLLSSGQAIRNNIDEDMAESVQSFREAINNRRLQLVGNATVLVSDFGFKQAVASRDSATIHSMLANHGQRVGADLSLILDLNGWIVSTTEARLMPGMTFGYQNMISDVKEGNDRTDFLVVGEYIYHIVMVPVRTPRISAIAVFGVRMTPQNVRKLITDQGMQITFINGMPDQVERWVNVSTLPDLESILQAIRAPENFKTLLRMPFEKKQRFSSRKIDIGDQGDTVQVILSDDLSRFYATYESITNQVMALAVLIFLITVMGSFAISHRLTRPLLALAVKSREIARGAYPEVKNIPSTSSDVSLLIRAFKRMRNDIAEREERITYQAQHDSLTGLLNRDAMITAVQEETEFNKPFILMGINLIGFKTINDTLGMEIGDECLITVAERLKKLAYKGITSRHSADEFSVLIELTPDCKTDEDRRFLCQRILNNLSAPMQLNEVRLSVDYRAGFVSFPEQADTPELLLRRGKVALEHAITTQDSLYAYKDGQDKVHLKKIKILKHLKETLQNDDDQLQMYYQPKKNLRTGEVEKAEALIRWFHPTEGFIPPDMFIELAEQTGLIGLVTAWVISRVLDDQKRLKDAGFDLQLSINLSAQDLSNDNLRQLLDQKLSENQLNAEDICLEVTERDMMTDVDKSLELLDYYRERGFQLSIDDYGVGYSALSKLALMPVHELKIDKCFILKLATQNDDQIIVRSTISMAHELGLSVIAEGVEDKASQAFLQRLGCDFIQGYYLAKPMSLDAFQHWLTHFDDPNHGG